MAKRNKNDNSKAYDIVLKHNNLIESRYDLTLIEQKIVLYAISKINRNEKSFSKIKIKVSEFTKLIESTEKRYTEIREIVRDLRNKKIIITEEENEIIIGWLSSIEYIDNEGAIEIEFNEKLSLYLLQLKEQSTSYALNNVLFLGNKHAIRLYELLKQYENIGYLKTSINDIRYLLILEEKYKDNKNFIHVFLKRSIDELNDKTDISIECEMFKENRKITHIKFIIKPKKRR